ncbi:hypothetical protein A3709_12090 [Halioglobus sp. HI00S01]|nr:hypothetical protein A3709_12090 [Halioglobus sp. HI00S01]
MRRMRAFGLLVFCLLLLLTSASRAQDSLVLSGLSVYTDTARDIYLAGLFSPRGVTPSADSDSAMAMEYRIETRRISTRGYFGTLLLQAEMGSEQRTPGTVIEVIEQIKVRVQGSFLRGDSIVIRRDDEGNTQFALNGTSLLVATGTETFDFFVQGWLGSNASSLLRDRLLANEMDAALAERFDALFPTAERVETVAAWGKTESSSRKDTDESKLNLAEAIVQTDTTSGVKFDLIIEPPAASIPEPEPERAVPESMPAPALSPVGTPIEPVIVTSAQFDTSLAKPTVEVTRATSANQTITTELEPSTSADSAERVSDDREYQLELSDYMALTVQKVFTNVEYPRRALKRQLQGEVSIVASVSADGTLFDTFIENSSGYPMLDRAAVRAVEKAAPFPQLSRVALEEFATAVGGSYELPIPINFAIRDNR